MDAGDGVTHAAPIYEGYALPHSIERTDLAGRDVTRYLRLLLRKEGTDLHTTAEFEIVRQIKERSCFVSCNLQKTEVLDAQESYRLPDGSVLMIGHARFKAPELLFRPDLIGEEYFGVHQVSRFLFSGCKGTEFSLFYKFTPLNYLQSLFLTLHLK